MTIQEYARAVAEAVLMVCEESGLPDMDAEDVRESLSDIIASVPRPTAQHHDAPTCDGWWWARHSFNRRWEAVLYVYDGNREEPEQYVVLNGQEEGRDVSEFDAWSDHCCRPTRPSPRRKSQNGRRASHAANKRSAPRSRVWTARSTRSIWFARPLRRRRPTSTRRRCGGRWANTLPGSNTEFAVDKIVAAAREYLRLREQPAPDVQAHCGMRPRSARARLLGAGLSVPALHRRAGVQGNVRVRI